MQNVKGSSILRILVGVYLHAWYAILIHVLDTCEYKLLPEMDLIFLQAPATSLQPTRTPFMQIVKKNLPKINLKKQKKSYRVTCAKQKKNRVCQIKIFLWVNNFFSVNNISGKCFYLENWEIVTSFFKMWSWILSFF